MVRTMVRGVGLVAALAGLGAGVAAPAGAAPATHRVAATCLSRGVHVSHANTKGLPRAAAAKARFLYRKAAVCDRATMQRIVLRKGGPRLSFGLDDPAYRRKAFAVPQNSEHRYDNLVRLLSLKPAAVKEGSTTSYVWPRVAVHYKDPAAWEEVIRAGLITRKQANAARKAGEGYYGFRTYISPRGEWESYVAGD